MKDNNKIIDELAKKVKKGDKNAFEELYRLTSSRAYFVALQICNDKQEAEDILQESYITALNKISSLERTESFMSWFNRIVVNKSKDFLRKKNPKLLSEDEEWLLEGQADEHDKFSPESNIDKEELKSVVMDAVQELSVEKRTCVMMRYFNDMSVNEIAQTMEVPVSTVKNRLFNARKELKSLFERKGITAAYSVAPFGVVGWAYSAAFESVAQSFEGSAAAAKIFSGIAVAGTAAATAATAGTATAGSTAAAGSGIFAKLAAASTMQKVVSGLVVAGVVTGSTVGITSVVKNNKKDDFPTAAYSETVDYTSINEDEDSVINVVKPATPQEEKEHEDKVLDYDLIGTMPLKINYKGRLEPGRNHITFEDDAFIYYVNFYADKPGYYRFVCDNESRLAYCRVNVPVQNPSNGNIKDFMDGEGNYKDGWVYYLDKGENTLVVEKGIRYQGNDTGVDVEYLGEEIAEIVFDEEKVNNVVLGYDEYVDDDVLLWQKQEGIDDGLYGNIFPLKIIFTDGTEHDLGECELTYRVKEGELKEGKNTAIFTLWGETYEKELTLHPVTDYVKEIEVDNLDDFIYAEIGEDGYVYDKPDIIYFTVTYADGSKETFNSKDWDGFIRLDNGVELRVTAYQTDVNRTMDQQLRSRGPLKFVVAIGESNIYVDRVYIIKDFDIIGFRKALDKNNLATAKEYMKILNGFYERTENEVSDAEDYLLYSYSLAENTVYYSFKLAKRIAGFELDYAITTYKILTENEFDIF
ncbi:MAG: RNA polymerase sigma factor [Clostridia bacterium]|nr:RNA polymerase sigma factor [Clostridia bacterium]MBQ3044336.1 RNA polymerase sigma factor [Clostridia bacterium]